MSKIATRSIIFYGTTVTLSNRYIDFDEGGSELTATLTIGDYSATEYAAEVQRALREAGALTYTVALSRTTRKLTISAGSNFTLRTNTGTHSANAAWTMMGYSTASNKTGASSYLADNGCGSEYQTQYPVSDYLDPNDNWVKEEASVNQSVTGIPEVVTFGDGYRIKLRVRLITNQNLTGQGSLFYYNATGVADYKTFISTILSKTKVEIMPDVDTRGTYYTVYLESTDGDRQGLSSFIRNMKSAPNIYEGGVLTFRKVIDE